MKLFQDRLKVFQVSGAIYDFLKLVLTSLSDFILDYIYKRPRLSNILVEKNLEFLIYDELSSEIFNLWLILWPTV